MGSLESGIIQSANPKFNGGVQFPLWKQRFEGVALANDRMQAFTTAIDMPVGDPSVTSCFLLHQGLSEVSVRRARIAWTFLTESITDQDLLSKVFNTNSSAGWRMLCDWFLLKTLSEKSKWKRQFNELVIEKEEMMRVFTRVDKIVGGLVSLGVCLPVEDVNLKIVAVLTDDYEFEQPTILYPCRKRGYSQTTIHNHVC